MWLLKKPTYRQHFRGRRRFNCAIMRKKLTPIFRQISDVATPKSVKKMAEMTVLRRVSKALQGIFRRLRWRVSGAETSYFVSSSCLQRSSDTSLHLSSQFKQCKWCLSWPCPARASNELGSSSWVSSWREVFCSLLDLMMLCSRDPVFQKESPRNEIKGVV